MDVVPWRVRVRIYQVRSMGVSALCRNFRSSRAPTSAEAEAGPAAGSQVYPGLARFACLDGDRAKRITGSLPVRAAAQPG